MNRLVHGDCLEVMGELAGGVRLAYLDPPFNTGERFADFHDAMDRRAWLAAMEPRLRAVVDGSDRGGISGAAGWEGGGAFELTWRASEAAAACRAA